MREYAIGLGVPTEDIVLDFAGRRTYDSCYRARHIFGIDDAIVISQSFHLPRAIYLCQEMGISTTGVPATNATYRKLTHFIWNTRELFATTIALWEIHVTHPVPVLGDAEPIF